MKLSGVTLDQYNQQCYNEVTAFPWFAIVQNIGGHRIVKRGVWFTREAAEKHLEVYSHHFNNKCYVYCSSGINSDLELFGGDDDQR